MGREVRRVPKDWQHPRDDRGRYIPMHDGDQETACKEYEKNVVLWACGAHPLQRDEFNATIRHYWDYAGRPPPEYGERGCHMFESPRDDLTHYMLYESTSEGTPCEDCPAFETMDELIDWAAENATTFADFKATREQWAHMLGSNDGNRTDCCIMEDSVQTEWGSDHSGRKWPESALRILRGESA